MSQLVKIAVYPFELHSALDQIHKWSRSQHWDAPPYSNPSFDIELEVMLDERGMAQKFNGDRFDLEDPFWYRSDEERAEIEEQEKRTDAFLEKLRKHGHSNPTDLLKEHARSNKPKSDSDLLMAHLKAKSKEQSND